jgi:citrate lyase subunit beta / citryl-CoA lyase
MTRPTRSWMFVPGNKQRFLDKAAESDVDSVLLDLEDGVLPSEKARAREMIAETLARKSFTPRRYVRVNAMNTPWYSEDIEAILGLGLDGVCLPKVESAGELNRLGHRLTGFEMTNGLPDGSVRILAAIESAAAIQNLREIAQAGDRVVGLMFGAEDFALDIGLGTKREAEAAELLYARSAIVMAAAARHILSIDGVFPDLDDEEGMRRDVWQARRLGFTSKSTFNPRQVSQINAVFSPQPDEIEYAERVISAFEEAKSRGDASVAVGGQLVDLPILRRAERIMELVGELGGAASGG